MFKANCFFEALLSLWLIFLTTNMMFFGSQWQKLSDHEVMNLWMIHTWDYHYHRVDGTNPAPVDMLNIPFFLEFHTCQVVQDFFHQQWVYFRLFRIPQPKSLQGFHPKIRPSRRFGIGPWKVMGTQIMELQLEIVSISTLLNFKIFKIDTLDLPATQ